MSGDFQIGEWSVQPAVNRLRYGDRVVRLEPKVMQVLVCLAETAGEVVTRDALISRVWPDVFVTDDVLHRAIRELRRVFGDSTSSPRYIETIRKRGYRLIPAVESVADNAGAQGTGPVSESEIGRVAAVPANDSQGGAWLFSIVAAGIAIAVAVAVGLVATRTAHVSSAAAARFVPIVSGPLNESDPAISSDGARVAFVQRAPGESSSADIFIRDLGDGQVTRVTHNPASDRMPAWSPDGSRLAFIRVTPASCDIIIRSLASGTETRVAACGNADDPRLAWTADALAILTSHAPDRHAATGTRIARIDIASGATMMLTDPPAGIVGDHSPAVSPDGQEVAFIRRASGGVSDIYIAPVAGGAARRVTVDEADLTGIDWASNGRSLVYSSDRAGGYSLWRVPVDGGTPSLIAGGAARMKHPVTDRTGRRVVYENWNYEINVWEAGPGEGVGRVEHAITRTSELWNLYPQVSPDGARVAYVSTQSGAHQLWIADRSGDNAKQLTRVAGGVIKAPRWSPDGRRIAYLARGRGGVDVHHVDVATGVETAVTSDVINEVAPAWSHDGRRILFGAPDDHGGWNVWSIDASAANEARLEVANAVAAQPSPDGAVLYFTRPDRPGLWRTHIEGGGSADLFLAEIAAANVFGWVVARDGIYFVEERAEIVHARRAPFDGGPPQDVAPLTQFTWPGFSIAPDGAVLYARWDRRDSNLMSIEF